MTDESRIEESFYEKLDELRKLPAWKSTPLDMMRFHFSKSLLPNVKLRTMPGKLRRARLLDALVHVFPAKDENIKEHPDVYVKRQKQPRTFA